MNDLKEKKLIVLYRTPADYSVSSPIKFLIQVFNNEYYKNLLLDKYKISVITTEDIEIKMKMSNRQFVEYINKNDEFANSIAFGIHPNGYKEILEISKCKNIKTVAWQDELHVFAHYAKEKDPNTKIAEYSEKYTCSILDTLDYIVTPNPIYFKNLNMTEYVDKTVDLFYFLNPDWFSSLLNKPYESRNNQVILSGSLASGYISRRKMKRLTEISEEFKQLVFVLNHPGYKTLEHDIIGTKYYSKLSEFKAAFVGNHKFPLNFCFSKHIESLMCGCLGFFDPNPLLESQLGLKEYVHYIPCYKDGALIQDANFYIEWMKNGEEIAKNGQRFVMENFGEKQIHKLFDFLKSIK